MSVYYIHAPEIGLVKIGYAADPWSRLGKAQVDSPSRLVLRAIEEGDKETEALRHRQFVGLRARGEWFRFEGELEAFVETLPTASKPDRDCLVSRLAETAGISKAYSSAIVNGHRASFEVLLHVFKTAGWRHPSLEGIADETLLLLGERFPYLKQASAA